MGSPQELIMILMGVVGHFFLITSQKLSFPIIQFPTTLLVVVEPFFAKVVALPFLTI
jgi:hypothetical protein